MKSQKTILVIEDERPLVGAVKDKLEKNGFAVITARAVDQALGYLEDVKTIDAIWLDHYLLGRENGLDFVTKFKTKGGQWNKVPIFVVSNTAGPDTVQSYIHFGISKYYVKAGHRLDKIIKDIRSFLNKPKE
jgi:DNA-binding response OmpR family regulator